MTKPLVCLAAALGATCLAAAEPPSVRLAYNYCTLSYTFAFYSDAAWEQEISRLAKAGYNAALVIDGTFKVWQMTLRDIGYGEEEIRAFIPDECARAWWLMGNLTGEGGPLDQATIDADGERGRRICALMRAKGIEPVLHGFTGMMPLGHPTAIKQGKWGCYERPPILDPTGLEYAHVADIWHKNLEKVYGFKPKYLAGDLFHEGGVTAGVNVTAATCAVQAAQQRAFPGVTWVVQAWQRNPTAAVRAGLDPRHTLVEALVKDLSHDPAPQDFGDLPWIWCEVLNFGGNHGLYGNLKTFARLGACTNATFRGYGALSEGFFTNEVCSDLFEEMMVSPAGRVMDDAELDAWLEAWVRARYGVEDARLVEAWRLLAASSYACATCQEGTHENLMCAKPGWAVTHVSSWGPTGSVWYASGTLAKARAKLKDAAKALATPPKTLRHDIVDVTRQVYADRARANAPNLKDDLRARRSFLADMATLGRMLAKSGDEAFYLETQLKKARERAGARGEKAFRRMVTTWADASFGHTTLEDYANREYAELILDYYLPRWRAFLTK